MNACVVVIESLGGYRLVRKLGEGERAEVFLAHPHRANPLAVPTVIKVFRPEVTHASVAQEIESISRGAGDHCITVLDLTTSPSGLPALILSRCSTGSVGKLITTRPDLRLGEAITVLAPLTATLARMHDRGVVHCSLRPDAILFDSVGTPMIGCFGLAQLVGIGLSDAGREADPLFGRDVEAMKQLVITVLRRVQDDDTTSILDWLDQHEAEGSGWLNELGEQLFRLGEPHAVDLRPCVEEGRPLAFPSRLVVPPSPKGRSRRSTDPKPPRRTFVIPDFVVRILPEGLFPDLARGERVHSDVSAGRLAVSGNGVISRVADHILDAARSVRRRFWIAGGLIGLALVAAIVLVPAPAAQVPQFPEPSPGVPTASTADETVGDDPAQAALALLQRRDTCVRTMSVLCLDEVVQDGSAASVTDRALVRGIQDGGELAAPFVVTASEMVLTERLGDTAIVSLGSTADNEPASLLLLKSEAGWRIRAYLPH